MNRRRGTWVAACLWWCASAVAADRTHQFTFFGTNNGFESCLLQTTAGTPNVPHSVARLTQTFRFADPLPKGARLVEISYTVSAIKNCVDTEARTMTGYLQRSAGAVTPIEVGSFTVTNCYDPFACSGTSPAGVFRDYVIRKRDDRDAFPAYNYGGSNDVVFSDPLSGNAMWFDYLIVTLTYEPPPRLHFDITDSTLADERRVLLHKLSPTDAYYSSHQTDDGRIHITGTVKDSRGAPLAFKTVYMRVYDPPDDSPYVPPSLRTPGDNLDTTGSAGLDGALPQGLLITMTDGTGRIDAILKTSDHVAGENYQLEASVDLDAFFSGRTCTETLNCFRSGVLTTWKRAGVEVDAMFRQGAFIGADTSAPDRVKLARRSRTRFKPGMRIRIVHSPRTHTGTRPGYYSEEAIVRDVHRGELLLMAPLTNAYYTSTDPLRPYLGDAVGIISGSPAADLFTIDPAPTADLWRDAYVDLTAIASARNHLTTLPHIENLSVDTNEARDFAGHWFENVGGPNTFHLIGGDINSEPRSGVRRFGITNANSDFSYVFAGAIEAEVAPRPAADRFKSEVAAHELTHQWLVNLPRAGDHCDLPTWPLTDGTLYCVMKAFFKTSTAPSGSILPEFHDGRVLFHYTAGATASASDSEYLGIRRAADPLP